MADRAHRPVALQPDVDPDDVTLPRLWRERPGERDAGAEIVLGRKPVLAARPLVQKEPSVRRLGEAAALLVQALADIHGGGP